MTFSARLSIGPKPGLLAISIWKLSERSSEKSEMKNGICSTSGRQDPSGLTFSRW